MQFYPNPQTPYPHPHDGDGEDHLPAGFSHGIEDVWIICSSSGFQLSDLDLSVHLLSFLVKNWLPHVSPQPLVIWPLLLSDMMAQFVCKTCCGFWRFTCACPIFCGMDSPNVFFLFGWRARVAKRSTLWHINDTNYYIEFSPVRIKCSRIFDFISIYSYFGSLVCRGLTI